MSEPTRRRRPQQPEQGQEIELEAVHGAGAAERRKRQEARLRKIRMARMRMAAMAVCAIVALFSLIMVVRIAVRSVRTFVTNRQLAQKREQLAAQQAAAPEMTIFAGDEETPAPEQERATAEPETAKAQVDAADAQQETPATAATAKKDVVRSTQYHVASGTPLGHMEALYNENRDLIGWLRMEKILDLPVMYKDNSYYLKRDFYKNKNEAGTLFLDENHRFNEWTQNLLLHGHNMKDGTMFGRLTQYLHDLSYLKNNPFVQFDTLWREEQYVIFAVMRVSLDVKDEDFFNYFSYPTFESDAQFNSYIRRVQLRSEYAIPLDVAPGDALLTLSTCLEDDRLVIVCRRLREGETRSQVREAIRLAQRQ